VISKKKGARLDGFTTVNNDAININVLIVNRHPRRRDYKLWMWHIVRHPSIAFA
jgi:hypothetical protein